MLYPELWEKLQNLELAGDFGGGSFIERVRCENGWTLEYTHSAVLEYKKFAYLAVISDSAIAPSDAIDQVWRNHLVDSKNYWGRFTALLAQPLHYSGTFEAMGRRKGLAEKYVDLLNRYQDEFGAKPPEEFWPELKSHLSAKNGWIRIKQENHWILPKPGKMMLRSLASFAGVAAFPLSILVYAINKSSGNAEGLLSYSGWIVVAAMAILIAVFGCLVWRNEIRERDTV